jgi:integrase
MDRIEMDSMIKEFLCDHRHLSTVTQRNYVLVIKRFIAFADNDFANADRVKEFLGKHQDSAGYYNHCLCALKCFFKWTPYKYGVFENPTKNIKQIPLRSLPTVRVLTKEEVIRLKAVKRSKEAAIAVFLCMTGLRLGEFIGLEQRNIDIARRVLVVLGKGSKPRFVPINETVLDLIGRYGMINHSFKGERYSYNTIRRKLNIAARLANIAPFNPHACRHFFATELLSRHERIETVSRLLGHKSIELTIRLYYHPQSLGNLTLLDGL